MSALLEANTRPSFLTTFQDPFSEEVWSSTYKDHNDKDINDTFWRVACAIASVELPSLRQQWAENFYDMMTDFKVVPGGRILANAGTEFKGTTLVNCFVSPAPKYDVDSIVGILQTLKDQSLTLKSEGGWGHNFSGIRPRGSFIKGIGVETPGSVKFMELFDKSSEIITEGSGKKSVNKKAKGKIRKGAMMAVLDCWHPDIIEFITAKQTPNRLQKFNVSVNCVDEFMQKVLQVYAEKLLGVAQEVIDEITWDLIFPDTTYTKYKEEWKGDIQDWRGKGYPVIVHKTVKVEWLWNLITQSTYNRNEPGILFLDRANKFNQLSYLEKIASTNPCISKNSWVTVKEGAKQVKDLIGVPFTAIVDGVKYQSSNDGFFPTGTKQLLKINTDRGYSIEVTNNHQVLIQREYTDKKYIWVEAGNLIVGDKLVLSNNRKEVISFSKKDDTDGYILGLLVGDGYISNGHARLCVWGNTAGPNSVHENVDEKMKLYGENIEWQSEIEDREEFRMMNRNISALAHSYDLSSTNKHITSKIEQNISLYPSFLRGFFDAHGTVSGSIEDGFSIRLNQSNIGDLQAAQRMLLRLGVASTIYEERHPAKLKMMPDGKGGKKEYYCLANHDLSISKDNIVRFMEIVGFGDIEKQNKAIEILSGYKKSPYKEKFLTSITSVIETTVEEVYDCQIPNKNAFVCDGVIVHNCGEQMLAPGSICVLGTLNLTQFVNKTHTGFDLTKVKKYVKYLVRFLDNVNQYSDAPLPEYVEAMRKKRRIGCGLMGWGSALYMMQVRFGSEKADIVRSELLRTFTHAGVEASIELAEEKGMFEFCDPDKHIMSPYWDNIELPTSLRTRMQKFGIRNSSLFSMQPNGNSGILANIVTGGIEPSFLHEYIRTVIVGDMPDHIASVTPLWYHGDWYETEMFKFTQEGDEQILRGVDQYGVVYKIDKNRGLTKEVLCQDYGVRYLSTIGEWDAKADWAVTTDNLSVNEHVSDLKGFAKAVDSACSKTVNLPNDYSFADFQNIYLDAYKSGFIKGLTTFRSGTMTTVLSAADQKADLDEEVILIDVKMPDNSIAEVKVLRDHEGGSSRKWYVTTVLNENRAPIALFVQTNAMEKTVTTNDAIDKLLALARSKGIPEKYVAGVEEKFQTDNNSTKIARAIGLLLRHGVHIKNIISVLDKVDGVTFASFLFHIKKLLSSYVRDGEKITDAKCIQCAGQLIYESGCQKCINCGNSKCG